MIIVGLLIFIALYLFNLAYILGIMICILAIILYFSNHRGFTHSLVGISILSGLIFLIIILGSSIVTSSINLIPISQMANNKELSIIIITIFMVFLFLNRRLLAAFLILFLSGIVFFPIVNISWYSVLFPLLLGFISHLILDSFTPSGIELFRPFSSKKVHKKFGIAMMILFGLLAIFNWVNILRFGLF
ncbi:inner membrane protein [Methanobrevibacter cuticularis]|uniref:Inner membrane protein n=2 Tax=Methanobrevibacter cuticularis TaxID=47311 RepID=A0A166DJD4_9EURY|nr:inner membrane protein [Methanobrevibacter cuticularis]